MEDVSEHQAKSGGKGRLALVLNVKGLVLVSVHVECGRREYVDGRS
jgi:hypothetical protein